MSLGKARLLWRGVHFYPKNIFLQSSSDKNLYLFQYDDFNRKNVDENPPKERSVLELIGTFPALAPFGSPDGIGGQASVHKQLICCGDQGGRVYLAKVHIKKCNKF